MQLQAGGDWHTVGLAEFDANEELRTERPGMAHDGAADAVVAADADDVAGIEAMASAKGNASFRGVDQFDTSVTGLAALISPGDRQLSRCGFTRL